MDHPKEIPSLLPQTLTIHTADTAGRMQKEESRCSLADTKLLPHHLSTSPIGVFVPSSLCHCLNREQIYNKH